MVDEVQPETVQTSFSNVFIVGIDGSDGSHNAFELVTKDLYKRNVDKIVLVHIYNSKKEHELGPTYKPKYIYNKYVGEIEKLVAKEDYEFVMEDRKANENVLEQVNEIAEKKKGTLLVIGFRGYKGAQNRPDNLSKSVTYLVHKPQIPCLIVKDKTSRLIRTYGQFKWLVCLESLESKSFKALETFVRFIDVENDYVHGINVYEKDKKHKETKCPIQSKFEDEMKKLEIKNFDFAAIEHSDNKETVQSLIKRWINEHLQKENHWIDFIVLGYNPSKYNFNKTAANTTVDMLKNVDCNIFFDH